METRFFLVNAFGLNSECFWALAQTVMDILYRKACEMDRQGLQNHRLTI